MWRVCALQDLDTESSCNLLAAGTLLAALRPGAPVDVTITNGAPTTIYFLPRFKNIAAMTVSSVRVGVSTVGRQQPDRLPRTHDKQPFLGS